MASSLAHSLSLSLSHTCALISSLLHVRRPGEHGAHGVGRAHGAHGGGGEHGRDRVPRLGHHDRRHGVLEQDGRRREEPACEQHTKAVSSLPGTSASHAVSGTGQGIAHA
eukprot:833881-Rhodomonas_salina.1